MEVILPSLVNFALVVGVLAYALRKPMIQLFATRSETISTTMVEASKTYAEASALLAEWKKKWDAREADARRSREEAATMISQQRQKQLERAKAETERIAREAVLVGQNEEQRARTRLQGDVVAKSLAIAREYLKSHIAEDQSKKLVGDFLEIVHGK